MSEQPMILRDVVRTLNALTRKQKTRLGLPTHVTERMVSLRFNRFADLIDPSPHTLRNLQRRTHLTDEQWDMEQQWRKAGLEHFLDTLLTASIPTDEEPSGSYAVDSTGLPSWARQTRKWTNRSTATDPDARWRSHMTTTVPYGKAEGAKPSFAGKAWYGYKLHAFVRIPNMDVRKTGECVLTETPAYIERIEVTAANDSDSAEAADLLVRLTDMLNERNITPSDIVMDRAYSHSFDAFLQPVREFGFSPHFDLREDQRGLNGTLDGMLIVDGQPYSPSLPKNLHNIAKPPFPQGTRTQIEEWNTANAERSRYLIKLRSKTFNTAGTMDFSCPAARDFTSMRCEQKPESLLLPPTIPIAPRIDNPTFPPKICQQQRIRVDGHELPLWQPHQYGTAAWTQSMNRRARVEGAFGRLKDTATQDINRGRIRVMGLAKTSIMAAMLVAAANIATTRRIQQATLTPTPTGGVKKKRGPRARTTRLAAHRNHMAAKSRAKKRLAHATAPSHPPPLPSLPDW